MAKLSLPKKGIMPKVKKFKYKAPKVKKITTKARKLKI